MPTTVASLSYSSRPVNTVGPCSARMRCCSVTSSPVTTAPALLAARARARWSSMADSNPGTSTSKPRSSAVSWVTSNGNP